MPPALADSRKTYRVLRTRNTMNSNQIKSKYIKYNQIKSNQIK